ncbi:MAG: type II secretion system protein GspK [Gemmataceae bacterium]
MRVARPRSRRGVVLLVVLIVIVLLTLAAYRYNDWMLGEARATESVIRSTQARAFATSGVHYAAALLAAGPNAAGGSLFDNPQLFQDIEVPTSATNGRTGRFSILTLRDPNDSGSNGQAHTFGVTCESGKVNLNALLGLDKGKGEVGKKILMQLPNMTDEIADSILDYIDTDDTARQNGAENEYYSALDPPYRCKNGPLDTLEELLLVKGVTPDLLFGSDRNRNGQADPGEGDGQLSLGWQAYLTVYSREVNVDPDGKPRIYLNNSDLSTTYTRLQAAVGEEVATYIAAARLYGTSAVSSSSSSSTSKSSSASQDIGAAKAKIQEDVGNAGTKKLRKISSIWDLVSSQVSVTVGTGRQQKRITYPSPMNDVASQRELFPKVWQYCTTSNQMDLTPRLNINTAPQAVLLGLKEAAGLQDSDIESILGRRPTPGSASEDELYKTPAWLLTELNLKASLVKKLDPYITTRSQVYSLQSVGYFDKGGPTARVEAVIDTNQGRPRIVYFRDVSELGKGFDVGNAASR